MTGCIRKKLNFSPERIKHLFIATLQKDAILKAQGKCRLPFKMAFEKKKMHKEGTNSSV